MAFPTLNVHLLLRNVTYKKEAAFVLDGLALQICSPVVP